MFGVMQHRASGYRFPVAERSLGGHLPDLARISDKRPPA
jgi:hypothetical protein